MKHIVKIEKNAQNDIEEASVWYEIQKKGLGKQFSDEVYEKLETVQNNPKIYQIVIWNIRRALLDKFPFSIFYLIKKGIVHIIGVLHQSRNPKTIKNTKQD